MYFRRIVSLGRRLKIKAMKLSWGFMATVLAIDAVSAFVVTLVFLELFDSDYLGHGSIVATSLLFAILSVFALTVMRTQKYIWRFISFRDAASFLGAAALVTGTGCLVVTAIAALQGDSVDSGPLVLQFLKFGVLHTFLLAATWLGTRMTWRLLQDMAEMEENRGGPTRRVLLVDAGVGCVHLLRSLEGAQSPIKPVGILEFNRHQIGRVVRGVLILGSPSELDRIVAGLAAKGQRPEEVVLTSRMREEHMLEVIERSVALKLKVSKLPSPGETSELIGKGLSPTEPITLQAIGGREPFVFDRAPIVSLVSGKRILVTGAGGSIGSQLVELIAGFGPAQLCLIDNCEFNLWKIEQLLLAQYPGVVCHPRLTDIRDANRLDQVFAEMRPELVFHAAALKHVPMVELNPAEGVLTNIVGTRNVADASLKAAVEAMVQVSTDKAVMPSSMMGATKRVAEIYCQSLDLAQSGPRFMTVRFGNVLGSSGSVVPIFERQIKAGGPVTVTHPLMERYFMTILEACELILHSAAHGARDSNARGVINVLDMGDPVKIVDVARRMILLRGLLPEEDIKIEFTGVRPGEKLIENLFNDGETRMESTVVGVHTALSESVPLERIKTVIERLAELAAAGDGPAIRAALEAVVPGYHAPHDHSSASEAA